MTPAGTAPSPLEAALVGRLLELPPTSARLPVALLSREQKAAELQRVQARKAMEAAYEAELVLGLADDTPDTADPPPGHPGARTGSWAPDTELPGVSEFFPAELAVVLNCGRGTASHVAQRAWTYRESLPGTWAAMAAGALDEARAKVLVDVLQHTTPAVARQVESRLLPEAAQLSTGRLRRRALALLLELDADAVDARREDAQRQADVRAHPSHREGMSTLAADLPTDEVAEAYDVINRLAEMAKADGDPRPIGQVRAEVFSVLLRRPGGSGLPGVTAAVTITAALTALEGTAATPGEVDGLPITAAHVRELAARIGALGLCAPEGGALRLALTGADGRLLATTTPEQLERLARSGCRRHPDGDCGCAVLGRPVATAAYAPTAAQSAFVDVRDRTCRFPNCGRRAGWADHDHVVPHACGGATDCTNLCCLCRSHHRLKTLARGWRFVIEADGTLHVTTPSGVTRTTRPPGLRPPAPEPPPPTPTPTPTPSSDPPPDDDPPPF
ncbi:HNH endonuclease signature motif containing protein [Geodermatophilus marinus]|uniref:HNH endonuclease signature motif containing protein n=1 Tax=Geodermatophilus sp. LHW52908 TaxID=2303986 RepID=UPI000E3ECE3D|nr:HNH endonuclease signature motif containing protein [Geodermatophilus sp. LHW52908]RFU21973.1 HNH endonuclease [Geodermatophilus sp. LHW52908]